MRTEKYNVATVIRAIEESKGLVSMAARKLGCNPQTVRNYAQRHVTVQQAIDEAREEFLDEGELALYEKVQEGVGWAVCFLLKTLGKGRGYVERQELTGTQAGPIRISYMEARQQLLDKLDTISARLYGKAATKDAETDTP